MPEARRGASNTLQNDPPRVLSQKKLYTLCHCGLDKPAPYLIRGNPVFSIWIPAGVHPVLDTGREGPLSSSSVHPSAHLSQRLS
jgi:hypothetical protein